MDQEKMNTTRDKTDADTNKVKLSKTKKSEKRVTISQIVKCIKKRKWSVSTTVLAITMIGIFWQAYESNRSVAAQHKFNDSALRPYLAIDPSLEPPFVDDSLIVVKSSLTNYGKTPAYNVVLIGRVTDSVTFPDSLLKALTEEDEEGSIAIAYPNQPGITFTGESVIRDGMGNGLLGVTVDSLLQNCDALYYHVYIEYESGWDETYYLRTTYRYEEYTMWSTIFASEEPWS